MSYTSTGGLPTIPRLAVAGVDEGAPGSASSSSGSSSGSSDPLTLTPRVTPAAPASGLKLYADATGKLSWIRASDGFTRTFEVTATANRTFTIPDASFTFAGQNYANTFTLANTFQAQTTILLGSAGSPAINFTGTSSGIYSSGSGIVNISVNGNERYRFAASTLNIINSAGEYACNSDTFFSRKGPANWQLGTADAAAPVAQTLSVQSVVAGTTDTAGVSWILNGSRGTGTGAGGSITFQVAPAGSSGSSQNSLVVGLQVYPRATSTAVRFSGYGNSYEYYNFADTSPLTPVNSATAIGQAAYSRQGTETTSDYGFAFVGNNRSNTAGTHTDVVVQRGFSPTSGTGLYVGFAVQPTINQTGGANGITRGIYVNPTLTAAADFRAIEVSAGDVVMPAGTTGMTSGFPHMPAAAGAPSGTPSARTGNVPFYYDTTNNKLYVYNGAWKSVTLT